MSGDGSIARRSGQILSLSVRDVLHGSHVLVELRETEVDQVYRACSLSRIANEEVVGLDIPVYDSLAMYGFDSGKQLLCHHQHGLQRELPVA
jgi:hypothetical protein